MDLWKDKFKKLLKIEKQHNVSEEKQYQQNDINQNVQGKEQKNFFPFSISSFLKKSRQQLSEKIHSTLKSNQNQGQITQRQDPQSFNLQKAKQNDQNPKKIISTGSNQPEKTVQILVQKQKQDMNNVYKFLQEKVERIPQQQKNNAQLTHQSDDDDDSLGYTENDWDEQTINFELEDRMLDCLQDEKHANQYRQSLAQSSLMRKRNQHRFTKLNRPPSPKDEDFNELDFEKIVQQHNPHFTQSKTKQQQAAGQKQQPKPVVQNQKRRNRFSKYKKQTQNESDKTVKLSSNQEEKRLEKLMKQKLQQLKASEGQTCEDYIERVFKIKTYEELKPIVGIKSKEDLQEDKKQQQIQQKRQQNFKAIQQQQTKKTQSVVSKSSFEVIQQQGYIDLGQLNNKQSGRFSPQNVYKRQQKLSNIVTESTNQSIQQSQHIQSEAIQQNKQPQQSSYNLIPYENEQAVTRQQKATVIVQQEKASSQQQKKQHNRNEYNQIKGTENIIRKKADQQNQKLRQQKFYVDKKLPIIYSPVKIPSQNLIQSPLKIRTIEIQNQPTLNIIKINPLGNPNLETIKSPRAKVSFNYVNVSEKSENIAKTQQTHHQFSNIQTILKNQKQNFIRSEKKRIIKTNHLQAHPQQRIPIFLQRLRRLISIYPNFYSSETDLIKIQNDLKTILTTMRSAISVIQLLFKKIKIQQNHLHELFILLTKCNPQSNISADQRKKYENEIWNYFINSGWQNQKIEEIEFIKPKQKFKRRVINPVNVDVALQMYTKFIDFYLNQPILTTKTPNQIQRYIRIRQKISEIAQYLRMISEDLYSYWLVDCHYPDHYYEFLEFLKQNTPQNLNTTKKDQIYAKLIQAQQFNDPLSLSFIGQKISQKVRQP